MTHRNDLQRAIFSWMIDYTTLPIKASHGQRQTPKTKDMKEEEKPPTPEDINGQYDDYQEDLLIRTKRLKILVSFTPTEDLYDRVLELLSYTPDLTKKSDRKKG